MNNIAKIIILVTGLAIVLPLANAEKLLRWLPPYGANPNNIFQTLGAKTAQLSLSARGQNETNTAVPQTNTAQADKPQTNPQTEQIKFTAPQKPYRVLLVGDSSMAVSGGFGDILEQKMLAFDSVSVLRKGKVSSGLSRPDYYDWDQAAKAAVAEFNPNITIVMMGTNDAQSFEIIQNGKKQVVAYGTPEWDKEYLNRTKSFINDFTGNDSILYWVGLPAMREPIYDQKIRHLAQIQQNAVRSNPMAKFISAADLMAGPQTAYQPFMADDKAIMRATRNSDGVHLSYFGGTILVGKIITQLKQDLDLTITPPETTSEAK